MVYLPRSHDWWLPEFSHAMVKWAAANMYLECWCASLGVLWLLSLMVILPLSQEGAPCTVPYLFLCFLGLCYFPGSQQIQDKQRLVLQAKLKARRWGQHGHGPGGGLKAFSVSGSPSHAGVMLLQRGNPEWWVGPGWHWLFWTLRLSMFQKEYEIYRH